VTRFLDTPVLVAVFLAEHPHHGASFALFSKCDPASASCAAHSLAEVYSTLTRIPAPHRASPKQAMQCVEAIAERLRLVSLHGQDMLAVLREAASKEIAGGTVYDALIAACALASRAEQVYSWNTRHFERLGANADGRLLEPPAE
jgi:predicted nucleic acid-binding protein